MKDKIYNTLYGAIVADALGVPVEFKDREYLKQNPVTDMTGYGTYNLPKGSWSDDSSMMLCLADSIAKKGIIDYQDIMQKFCSWFNKGDYTADGELFDIGGSCRKSIMNYLDGVEPLDCGQKSELDNGNGSLMRIACLPFFLFKMYGPNALDSWEAFEVIHNVSRLTHAHFISLIGCDIYCSLIIEILKGCDKSILLNTAIQKVKKYSIRHTHFNEFFSKYEKITKNDFANLREEEINSSGFVVDTLEAALWCFLNTNNYHDCVLKAVNLGNDTDTVACVAGSIAGLYYGNIPDEWIESTRNKELISSILNNFGHSLNKIKKIVFKHLCRFSMLGNRLFSGFILYEDGTLFSAIEDNKKVSLPLEELPSDFELREFPIKLVEHKLFSSETLLKKTWAIIKDNESELKMCDPILTNYGTMDGEDNILQFGDKIIIGYAILEKHWYEIKSFFDQILPDYVQREKENEDEKQHAQNLIFIRNLFLKIQNNILEESDFPVNQKEYGGSFWNKKD